MIQNNQRLKDNIIRIAIVLNVSLLFLSKELFLNPLLPSVVFMQRSAKILISI